MPTKAAIRQPTTMAKRKPGRPEKPNSMHRRPPTRPPTMPSGKPRFKPMPHWMPGSMASTSTLFIAMRTTALDKSVVRDRS